MAKLTDARVRAAKPGKHADGGGLYLQVRRSGTRDWSLRIMVKGHRFEMGLGAYPMITLEEAREEALKWRKVAKQGGNPIAERAMEQESARAVQTTLAEAIHAAFEHRKGGLKDDGKAGRWMSPLSTHVLPKLGSRPIAGITKRELVELIEPIWREKHPTAHKLLDRLGYAYRHAHSVQDIGLDPGLIPAVRAALPEHTHETNNIPAMDWTDVPAFYASLVNETSTGKLALRLLILTVVRSSPVRFARTEQFDLQRKVWTVPGANMKGARGKTADFRIPLSNEALEVVKTALPFALNGFLFPGYRGRPTSDMTMSRLMERANVAARPHGFRSSFSTWCAETGKDPLVSESALAHEIGNKVSRAYRRTDLLEQRRRLLDDWAAHVVHAKEGHKGAGARTPDGVV